MNARMRAPMVLLTLLLLGLDGLMLWPSRLPQQASPASLALCDCPVEFPSHVVRCLTQEQAQALWVTAGDVVPIGPDGARSVGPPRRMSGEQQLALGLRIDPNRATEDELTALPDVGPTLAHAMIQARQQAPFRRESDLRAVRGLGEKRLHKLRPYLVWPGSQ
ncbi:MAG: helix-hairpin-helix domain-containing protein [Myxococcales bacterium]|nr:helix-hairpin-helix domain-containing protein [Myxococcales bacterium]